MSSPLPTLSALGLSQRMSQFCFTTKVRKSWAYLTWLCGCRFPKLGAYAAFGVPNAEGRMQAVFCADTLIPAGSGRPLADDARYSQSPVVTGRGDSFSLTKVKQCQECISFRHAFLLKRKPTNGLSWIGEASEPLSHCKSEVHVARQGYGLRMCKDPAGCM